MRMDERLFQAGLSGRDIRMEVSNLIAVMIQQPITGIPGALQAGLAGISVSRTGNPVSDAVKNRALRGQTAVHPSRESSHRVVPHGGAGIERTRDIAIGRG